MSNKINYDIFDLTKLILSLMVVAIHTNLFPMLYPWLRIAVPMFFIISSFLLSEKIKKDGDKKSILKNYTIRLLKLYTFWFVILLPVTIIIRHNWFDEGIIKGCFIVIKNIFFGSTFSGSWYLTATIFGTLVVYNISDNKINRKILLCIFVLFYIFCCIASSYSFIIKSNLALNILKTIQPQFTFLTSLIFIYIGKLYSEKDNKLRIKNNIIGTIIFAVLLFLEWKIIYKVSNNFDKDCYIFIMPLAYYLFGTIKLIKINVSNSKTIRNFSSFIYPFHISLIPIIKFAFSNVLNIEINNMILYIITVLVSLITFFIVEKLEKNKKFKLLKYSH